MTKNFCDICGQPAILPMIAGTYQLPDRKWSGTKSTQVSLVDGTYVPTFRFHLVVRVEDLSERNQREHIPDLCANCTGIMLRKLTEAVASDATI